MVFYILFTIGIIIVLIFVIRKQIIVRTEWSKGSVLSKEFNSKMCNRGFTRRIVVYDLLSEQKKKIADSGQHWYTVGIWLDYQKQMISLRTDRDTWDEIDIPFNKIQKVEIIEDGYAVITGRGVGYGGFGIGSAKSKEFSKGLQVRIVAGDINTGTNAYFLNIYDPKYGAKYNKSNPDYRVMQECARLIADELENILRH